MHMCCHVCTCVCTYVDICVCVCVSLQLLRPTKLTSTSAAFLHL